MYFQTLCDWFEVYCKKCQFVQKSHFELFLAFKGFLLAKGQILGLLPLFAFSLDFGIELQNRNEILF